MSNWAVGHVLSTVARGPSRESPYKTHMGLMSTLNGELTTPAEEAAATQLR